MNANTNSKNDSNWLWKRSPADQDVILGSASAPQVQADAWKSHGDRSDGMVHATVDGVFVKSVSLMVTSDSIKVDGKFVFGWRVHTGVKEKPFVPSEYAATDVEHERDLGRAKARKLAEQRGGEEAQMAWHSTQRIFRREQAIKAAQAANPKRVALLAEIDELARRNQELYATLKQIDNAILDVIDGVVA